MFIVGLTGGIATGKSTVSGMIRELGCPVIDADQISRDVVEVGQPAYKKIVSEFGESVLLPSGELNRAALGEIIFNDESKRRLLNKCTHTYIHRRMRYIVLCSFLRGHQFIVMDLPLLYETGTFLKLFHKVIVVECTPDQEVERLMLRNSLSREQALARINSQMPLEQKVQRADIVISNRGTLEETRQQTVAIVNQLKASNMHIYMRLLFLSVVSPFLLTLYWVFR
ncbi:dephospho-CoA kinase-like [Sycon ciliatum]|uniref:dephospho-CoA kinase-like n=1 Tax=Sycon ciliatum TaxID=27933 RepID=UPI0020AE4DAD|eukprot:scpid84451/ scgid17708/ Dephospho-CoA kinase domain-containing protein